MKVTDLDRAQHGVEKPKTYIHRAGKKTPFVSVVHKGVAGRALPFHPGEEPTVAAFPISSYPVGNMFSYRGVGLL